MAMILAIVDAVAWTKILVAIILVMLFVFFENMYV